jgi:hypothetical protein
MLHADVVTQVAASDALMRVLDHCHSAGSLRRFVVDEAHCVSAWGTIAAQFMICFESASHAPVRSAWQRRAWQRLLCAIAGHDFRPDFRGLRVFKQR